MSATKHGFRALFGCSRPISVSMHCCLKAFENKILMKDDTMNVNPLKALYNDPRQRGNRDSLALKKDAKKEKKKADLVLSSDVVIVDAARACAMNALGKSVVKSDVPSACLPRAWDNGPGQDGALMGRSLYQKIWKK